MPRNVSALFDRSSPSPPPTTAHYYKSDKTRKPMPLPSQSRASLPFIVFCAVCLVVGVAGFLFFIFAVLRPKQLPVFRCGSVEDTFRAFYSLSNARRLGGDAGGLPDRPKLLGFVGIQTGFSSGERRAALRSTWFPSDPGGLLR